MVNHNVVVAVADALQFHRLEAVERENRRLASGTAPAMIVVIAFRGERVPAAEYVAKLHEHYKDVPEPPYIETLYMETQDRHPRHKPDWESPAAYLEYIPSREETSDRRPDIRNPGPNHTRRDWRD